MNKKSFSKFYIIIAAAISVFLCIGLIYLLWQRNENDLSYAEIIHEIARIFIGVSGFLAAILLIFLANAVTNIKRVRSKIGAKIVKTTQQMHHFRTIAHLLINSNMWPDGLKEYMEKEFPGLSYFEVKDFYKGNSKTAIEFLQETHHFGGTENIYLELKSLLMTSPNEKYIPNTLSYPLFYGKPIIEKWAAHKSGSGLWYIFGYKYANYRDSLQLDKVYERHQEKILTLANTIDRDLFEASSFNEIFLAKLWEYLEQDVLPKLVQFQSQMGLQMPALLRYLYFAFLLLMIFGLLLPLLYLMLDFSNMVIIASYSIVISSLFFIAITFHIFLSKEMEW